MEQINKVIVDIVLDNLPLNRLSDRSRVRDSLDAKLMSEIGLSFQRYNDVLQEVQDHFSISAPAKVKRGPVRKTWWSIFFVKPDYRDDVILQVPDLSIRQLAMISERGEWPLEYYYDVGTKKADQSQL